MQNNSFPLLEVSGSSYQMGYRHGAEAGDLVRRTLLWIEKQSGAPRQKLARRAMEFLPATQAVSPAYVEEVRGLAEGARLPFEDAWLIQCRSEATAAGTGCSAFACTGTAAVDGRPLAGQNQDLEPEYADLAIVLRVAPDDGRPQTLMVTFAGQLGYAGMNEWGLALFHNAIYGSTPQGDLPRRPRLPRQPVKRLLLERPTVSACAESLAQWQIASTGNFLLCDRDGAFASIEYGPGGIALVEQEQAGLAFHTNHYMAAAFGEHKTQAITDSMPRLERLRLLARQAGCKLGVTELQQILADHDGDPAGICRHGATGWHSIAGYIAEPARGRLHVRRGHGCLGAWQTFEV